MELYRKNYNDDSKAWAEEKKEDLNSNYWKVHDSIASIPSNKFNQLKAKYRRKLEISKLLDSYPHCPIWLMKLCFSCRYAKMFISEKCLRKQELDNE